MFPYYSRFRIPIWNANGTGDQFAVNRLVSVIWTCSLATIIWAALVDSDRTSTTIQVIIVVVVVVVVAIVLAWIYIQPCSYENFQYRNASFPYRRNRWTFSNCNHIKWFKPSVVNSMYSFAKSNSTSVTKFGSYVEKPCDNKSKNKKTASFIYHHAALYMCQLDIPLRKKSCADKKR
jgi:hypothetical protein